MKIRITSDLHVDVNRKTDLITPDDGIFTLVAGDLAGIIDMAESFLKLYKNTNFAFIGGNHIVYDVKNFRKDIRTIWSEWSKRFPKYSQYKFIENDYLELDSNTIIIGATLYTDFSIRNKMILDMESSFNFLNDFRFYVTYEGGLFTPQSQQFIHFQQKSFIEDICKKNPNKKIILLLHHGISPKCFENYNLVEELQASYASDLEEWIKSLPNVKLVIHGHIHRFADYKIGNARIIQNAYGYESRNENANFNYDLIVDTDEL